MICCLNKSVFAIIKQYYKRETVEMAEQFQFFKRVQRDMEGVAEYIAELRKLGKLATLVSAYTPPSVTN